MPAFLAALTPLLLRYVLPAAGLAVFVTTIAYLHRPRLKALVYSLPVPFTLAYLATRHPLDSTNLTGLALVVGYNWLVYFLHRGAGLPLRWAIGFGVAAYIVLGIVAKSAATIPLPVTAAALLFVWLGAVRRYRPRAEPGHRSLAPWWIKAPLAFAIGLVMYTLTGLLAGAVTTFPYAGVFTSYEARHSLRTLAGQFTINALGIGLMIVVMWGLQQMQAPAPWPLVTGWAAALGTIGVIYRRGWGRA